MIEGLLGKDSASLKANAVLANGMAKRDFKDIPLLQPFVDCFMACTSFVLGSLVSLRHKLTWHAALGVSVSAICLHHFTWRQVIGKLGLEDLQV
jgi:hypothetical protein